MTTYTPENVREIVEDFLDGFTIDGIELELPNIERYIDLDDWADELNETLRDNPKQIDNTLAALHDDAYEAIHDGGVVTTRLEAEAETEIDGERYRIVWIPENLSWVHGPASQWEIAFAEEDNPPFEGQFHTATGSRQTTVQMHLMGSEEDLYEGCMYLEPLN